MGPHKKEGRKGGGGETDHSYMRKRYVLVPHLALPYSQTQSLPFLPSSSLCGPCGHQLSIHIASREGKGGEGTGGGTGGNVACPPPKKEGGDRERRRHKQTLHIRHTRRGEGRRRSLDMVEKNKEKSLHCGGVQYKKRGSQPAIFLVFSGWREEGERISRVKRRRDEEGFCFLPSFFLRWGFCCCIVCMRAVL